MAEKKKRYKRKYLALICSACAKITKVRDDYYNKHSRFCPSCALKGNTNAKQHGDYKERLYKIWVGLKHRRYSYIPEICEEWANYEEFKKWALESGYREDLTIDRRDNRGGYNPKNCQWITLEENAGKDKIIFSDNEKNEVYKLRKSLGVTQVTMATIMGVSRNTIYRAEKYAKGAK